MGFNFSQATGIRGDIGNLIGGTGGGGVGGQFLKNFTPLGWMGAYDPQTNTPIDYNGQPKQPAYTSQLESPTYRSMQSQYASGSASPWANIAIARQGDLAEKEKQDLMQKNSGQTAASLDKLATVGGLTSGARERTVQKGQQNYMTGVQDIGNAYKSNVMNIGLDDAQAKMGIGKGLLNAEMGDLSGRNNYNQTKYAADMAAWAAMQQANATRDAGSGGFLSGLF